MTVLLTSMPLPVREQAPEPGTCAAECPVPDRLADAVACQIAARVARGEERAFRELYDHYHGRLLRLALLLVRGDESLAQETVQAVFLTAASKLRRVESEAHLWNWLARIARQHIGKVWRQQGRDLGAVSLAELPEQPAQGAPDTELEERLDAALLKMDSDDRTLLEWFYFDDLSHKEIAKRLEMGLKDGDSWNSSFRRLTPKAVSSRLERARVKLKTLLVRKEIQ